MTELLNVYKDIYGPRLEYCVICFRSGSERRMVSLKNLETFVKSINLPFNYIHEFQRVCWVCERGARAAFRMRIAVNLSASIHGLFACMERSARPHDIAEQLRGNKKPVGLVTHALEWQTRLAALRARTQLLHTEVLVVASVPPSSESQPTIHLEQRSEVDETLERDPTSPPDESGVYLIPDAPPLDDALREPEIFMESVIIEDDEQDPIGIKQENPDELSDNTPLLDSRITTIRSHASRGASRGATRGATRGAPLPAGAAGASSPAPANTPSIVPIQKLMDNADNTSFLLHPIVESNGVMSVPSLNAQIINGQLMTVDNSSLIIQTPKLALHSGMNLKLVTEPNQVTTLLKGMKKNDVHNTSVIANTAPARGSPSAHCARDMDTLMAGAPYHSNNAITHSIIIDDDDAEVSRLDARSAAPGQRQSAPDTRKKRDRDKPDDEPPKKQKETDWEDKIPMDVISYMDATDPNAMQELRGEPTLGVISSVQSVTEETHLSMETDTGINSAQDGINRGQTGIITMPPGINNVQLLNSVQGINSTESGDNLILTLLDSDEIVNSSVRTVSASGKKGSPAASSSFTSGASTVPMTSSATQTNPKGVKRLVRKENSVHQNVFASAHSSTRNRNSCNNGDVIDLC